MTTESDPMRVDRPLLLLLAALTAGCADPEPFVDYGSVNSPSLNKLRDPVLQGGIVKLCYSDQTPWAEVEQLAAERCAAHGLKVYAHAIQRYQCRATAPHRANFRCYDPEMLKDDGTPVNVFDAAAVAAWEKRTGKTAKPHNALSAQGANQESPAAAATPTTPPAPSGTPSAAPATAAPPAPASVAPLLPLNPADIAGKPPIPALPPRQAPQAPPGAGAYPTDGFTLPQGSWGDHFQE